MIHEGPQYPVLCAADIGNSSISIGYFTGDGLVRQNIPTNPLRAAGEYREACSGFLAEHHIAKTGFPCIISSVVPGHTAVVAEALSGLAGIPAEEVLVVHSGMDAGISFSVPFPERLGTDRLANAAAAWARCGAPVAVADFGTATTITVVGGGASLIGGAILPGLGLMGAALAGGTSQLPALSPAPVLSALGRDTETSIRSGIVFGTAGAVERILQEIERETGSTLRLLVTGGFGLLMDSCLLRTHELCGDLTMEGLRILYERNRPA